MARRVESQAMAVVSDHRRFSVHRGGLSGRGDDGVASPELNRVGLLLLLISVSIIFASLVSAYLVRMDLADWQSVALPGLLWLNTAVLVLASVVWQATVHAVNRDREAAATRRLLAAGALVLLFIVGQAAAWMQMRQMGNPLGSSPASSFFYLITLIHALHVLGGLAVWVRTLLRLRAAAQLDAVKSAVQLSATYWHFLLVVWLVMFGLMLAT